jgi:uncharacterized protein YydD (DUF2326 family)
MFIKSLTLAKGDGTIIRNIPFHVGLNLIVDETPVDIGVETGNNVGKTTVLKLIDFCLGANQKNIYTDPENERNEYKLVKDFLSENKVRVSLVLKDDLQDDESQEVLIERNFLPRSNKIQRVNGKNKTIDGFDEALTDILFPGHYDKKPTFRQIIAHNIRYSDQSINNTLKHLDRYTRDDEYEALYLFLFGVEFDKGDLKQDLRSQITVEEKIKKRLESNQTKSGYESALELIQVEIEEIEKKKASLNLNPNFESDLEELNNIKYQINLTSSEISRLNLRKELIIEAQEDMQAGKSNIDLQQLRLIYEQATSLVNEIQKTFDELNEFHNNMVESKIRFITQDLPKIDRKLSGQQDKLHRLLLEEKKLSVAVTQSDSFEVLEQIVSELNEKHRTKGNYESTLNQLNDIDSKLATLNNELAQIDDELFSDDFAKRIQIQINKFNRHFSLVSNKLYGESYALKFDKKNVKGRRLYQFTSFNTNFSSGKKLGEISCFDIAYTLFANEENIPCMHFLLNDKKELMHDNQLINIVDLVETEGIQLVSSILRDKLPNELNDEKYIVLSLSQDDKLFRIENA